VPVAQWDAVRRAGQAPYTRTLRAGLIWLNMPGMEEEMSNFTWAQAAVRLMLARCVEALKQQIADTGRLE
jgi:hypothetical protein